MLHIAELSLPLDFTPEDLRRKTAARLKVPEKSLGRVALYRRSVDARKKDAVRFICTVEAEVEGENRVLSRLKDSKIRRAEAYQ